MRGPANTDAQDEGWNRGRAAMVEQLRAYKVRDERVLTAMGKVCQKDDIMVRFVPTVHGGGKMRKRSHFPISGHRSLDET